MLTALLFWIMVGLIAGVLAKVAMPGPDPGGILVTILIGIGGAILGGWLLQTLLGIGGGAGTGGFLFSIVAGIIGAMILLALYRFVANRVG